jgi:peptidoglycan hydrolase-like protein with peptidoglycan-binding domain
MRGAVLAAAGVAAIILLAAATLLLRPSTGPAAAAGITVGTVQVTRTDIVNHQRLAGILAFGPAHTVLAPGGAPSLVGALTSLPGLGSVVLQGQALYSVNDSPVVLLYGDHPAWRTIGAGSIGPDVKQLEDDLLALGFATPAQLHNDGVFTVADAAAVIRFQSALGVTQTGALIGGSIIFQPGAVRVTAIHPGLGSELAPGEPVLDVTSTTHLVSVELDAGRADVVKPGDIVSIQMPDGTTTVAGHVSGIGRVAHAAAASSQGGGGGGPAQPATVTVSITLDEEAKAGSLDLAPVYVSIAAATHKNVLAVPVTALLAEPDGTYAVAVRVGAARHTVQVVPGLFGDAGLVEVTAAGLNAGNSVEVPAR